MDSLCSTCGKGLAEKRKLHPCDKCSNYYHTQCTTFKIVLDAHNRKVKLCNIYLVNINTPTSTRNSSRPSISVAENTRSRNNSTNSNTSAGGMSDVRRTPISSDEIPSMLLNKTDKMHKLDGIEAKISNFQTDKLANFSEKLQILETISALVQRVDATAEDIDKLKSDYNSLRQIVDSKLSTTDSAKSVAVTNLRFRRIKRFSILSTL